MIALTSKVTIFVAIIQKIKMKMKKLFAVCFVALLGLISFHLQAQEVETQVLIDTDMGKIKVKLFNDTPLHRDNFIKNV